MILISNNDINDPTINLALEEYCVRNLNFEKENYLLFYINEPSIIIGKHQCTLEEINYDYVKEHNIHIVRRISGGGAVYHDKGNLNFSFLSKHTDDSIHNFEKFTKPVRDTLVALGVNAEMTGRNDIVVEGRKISGNAQFTNMKAMFSHGTLLFDSHLEDVVQALNVKMDKIESKGIKSIRSRVANITEFLKEPISIIQFREKIIQSIFRDYKKNTVLRLSEKQWGEVLTLAKEKYRNWDWNLGRSPEFNVKKTNRFSFGQVDTRLQVKDGIIRDIKFFGDFLGHGDTEEIEKKLIGKKYNEEEITRILNEFNLNLYFGEITVVEFVKYLIS
ncbi:MAG: lipoate--protein ligase [Ignavibacteriae bacterium]|nr:lipoate--protein ligase [Ignavibacteriota bacterium]